MYLNEFLANTTQLPIVLDCMYSKQLYTIIMVSLFHSNYMLD